MIPLFTIGDSPTRIAGSLRVAELPKYDEPEAFTRTDLWMQ